MAGRPCEPPRSTGTPHLDPARLRLVLAALMLGVLLAALDGTIVAVALPTIVGDLGDVGDTSWIVTAYLLTATASTPLYGRISDVYGRKPTFVAAVLIFLVGSALCGLAQDIGSLAAARAVQGLGGGGLLALALAVIADLVPDRRRARYHALFGAVYGLASLIGPLIGGLIVDNMSWRWLFYVNLPLGALALAVVVTRLDLPARRRDRPLDIRGAVLLAVSVGAFLCALARSQEAGFGSPQSWAPGLVAVVALVGFVATERGAAEPVLPLRLFAEPGFALTSAVAFLVGVAMFATILFVPLTLQVGQQRSATSSGLMLLAMMAGLILTTTAAGRVIARTGRYKVFPVLGTALMTLALLGLAQLGPDTAAAATIGVLAVLGLGLGLVSQVLVLSAQGAVGPREIGVATASVSFFRNLGGTVGTAVCAATLATVLTNRLGSDAAAGVDVHRLAVLPDAVAALPPNAQATFVAAFTDAANAVFWIAAPLAALAFVLTLFIPERPLAAPAGDPPAGPRADEASGAGPVGQSADQYASPRSTSAAAPTSPAS